MTDLVNRKNANAMAWVAVVVAALGYFVDVFDMWLFANNRVKSLTDLGLSGPAVTNSGLFIINCQQAGFIIGGFLWGILADIRRSDPSQSSGPCEASNP